MEYKVVYDIDEKKVGKARKFIEKNNTDKLDRMFNRIENINRFLDIWLVLGTIVLIISGIIDFSCTNIPNKYFLCIYSFITFFSYWLFFERRNKKEYYAWTQNEIIRNTNYIRMAEILVNIEVLKLEISEDECMVTYKMPGGTVEEAHLGWNQEEAYMCDVDKPEIHFKHDMDFEYIDRLLIPYDYEIS